MKYYIYKIIHISRPEWFYIGSTNNFSRRKSSHKKAHKNKVSKKYWTKLYIYIRMHGWDSFEISIIEEGEVETKYDIKVIEQKFLDNLVPTLNSNNAISKTI